MPPTVSGLHQRGQELYQKGEFQAAIEAFSEVSARTRPNPKWKLMGYSTGVEAERCGCRWHPR